MIDTRFKSKAEVARRTSSTLHTYSLLLAYLLEAGHIEEGVAVVQCSGTHHPRVVGEALEVSEQEEQAAVPVREEHHEEEQLRQPLVGVRVRARV